jgi:short subunit dehydrogenase-like uncharacterized protein
MHDRAGQGTGDFLLYGATGYTGELIARRAAAAGLRPTLAGRSSAVAALASELGLPHRTVSLDDVRTLGEVVHRHPLVLNCAGPFVHTFRPLVESCLRQHAHYLDITGEIEVFERLALRDPDARRAGIMLLPGVGFDVVPSDCLAAHVASHLPDGTHLEIAVQGIGRASRGTTRTMLEHMGRGSGGAVRRGGKIVSIPPGSRTREVDFGRGPVRVTSMPWGDVSTAWHSTRIPDIDVYMALPESTQRALRWSGALMPLVRTAPVRGVLDALVRRGPAGPSAEERARGESRFWAEVRDERTGERASARLVGPEGYELTVRTAMECVRRVLAGEARAGFQTPSSAFGADFVLGVEGVRREDLP